MTVYIKGKPMTPPSVGGITFSLFDEARNHWSGAGTAPQELALTPTGSVFMTQAEYDRFKADFDALATYDTAIAAAEATALATPTAANAKAVFDIRGIKNDIPSVVQVRNGKTNPFF
jgi:hypothetical protein